MTSTPKIGLIADDFTGAMDSGAQFSFSKLSVHFRFNGQPSGDVELINTGSRELDQAEAIVRNITACHALAGRSLFKKIDSTLRGHVAAEVKAILSASAYQKAVICPAAPLQGRVVLDGVLLVNGIPLEQTSFKDDPVYPARSSRVVELIKAPTLHLPLELVRAPLEQLTASIKRAEQVLITSDAETAADLQSLARAIIASNALPCGAFGLAKAYLQALNAEVLDHPTFQVDQPTLVLIGSANQTAREQVDSLASMPESLVLKLGANPAPGILEWITERLPANLRTLTLCAAQDKTVRSAEWLRFGETVSAVGLALVEHFGPHTILVVGGESVTHFCRLAGTESIQVLGEVMPGIPFGRIRGGKLDGMLLITKAGGFGTPDTLKNILYPKG